MVCRVYVWYGGLDCMDCFRPVRIGTGRATADLICANLEFAARDSDSGTEVFVDIRTVVVAFGQMVADAR